MQNLAKALLQRLLEQALHARQIQKHSYLQRKWWSGWYLLHNSSLENFGALFLHFQ